MNVILINSLLMLCLEGNYICERASEPPKLKFYESGKSCYIEGQFYSSCPPQNYDRSQRK